MPPLRIVPGDSGYWNVCRIYHSCSIFKFSDVYCGFRLGELEKGGAITIALRL